MKPEIWNWVRESYEIVRKGITNRMDSPDGNIKVYKCGSVISDGILSSITIRIVIKEDLGNE